MQDQPFKKSCVTELQRLHPGRLELHAGQCCCNTLCLVQQPSSLWITCQLQCIWASAVRLQEPVFHATPFARQQSVAWPEILGCWVWSMLLTASWHAAVPVKQPAGNLKRRHCWALSLIFADHGYRTASVSPTQGQHMHLWPIHRPLGCQAAPCTHLSRCSAGHISASHACHPPPLQATAGNGCPGGAFTGPSEYSALPSLQATARSWCRPLWPSTAMQVAFTQVPAATWCTLMGTTATRARASTLSTCSP